MNLCDYGCCPREVRDWFCGAGGAAMGLHRAWPHAHIVGYDIKPQPRYPFDFVQGDALEAPTGDFTWASPPCQGYSIMRNLPWLREKAYPLLIGATRARLQASAGYYAIENVMGAHREMDAWWLCGGMFGLPFYRHRLFETNFFWLQPAHPRHQYTVRNGRTMGARARDVLHGGAISSYQDGYGHRSVAVAKRVRAAMGVEWMGREYTEAIPPAYSEYIARQMPLPARVGHACPTCGGWMPLATAPGECFACGLASEREAVRGEVARTERAA